MQTNGLNFDCHVSELAEGMSAKSDALHRLFRLQFSHEYSRRAVLMHPVVKSDIRDSLRPRN